MPIGVSKLCKTSVAFIKKGVKINQEYYCSHVPASLIPEMNNLADNDYVFMKDGARSRTAKSTVEYLNSHGPELINSDSWHPNSIDLKLYGLLGMVTAREDGLCD